VRKENRACRTSRRGSSSVFGSRRTKLFLWQAEQGSRRTRRHPRDDPRAEVGEDVHVGVGVRVRVGAVECQLNWTANTTVVFVSVKYGLIAAFFYTHPRQMAGHNDVTISGKARAPSLSGPTFSAVSQSQLCRPPPPPLCRYNFRLRTRCRHLATPGEYKNSKTRHCLFL